MRSRPTHASTPASTSPGNQPLASSVCSSTPSSASTALAASASSAEIHAAAPPSRAMRTVRAARWAGLEARRGLKSRSNRACSPLRSPCQGVAYTHCPPAAEAVDSTWSTGLSAAGADEPLSSAALPPSCVAGARVVLLRPSPESTEGPCRTRRSALTPEGECHSSTPLTRTPGGSAGSWNGAPVSPTPATSAPLLSRHRRLWRSLKAAKSSLRSRRMRASLACLWRSSMCWEGRREAGVSRVCATVWKRSTWRHICT